jgi:hypothetical protein
MRATITTENREKKRNLLEEQVEHLPRFADSNQGTDICERGATSLIMVWLYAYHGQIINPKKP